MTDSIEAGQPPRLALRYAWAVALLLIAVLAVGAALIVEMYAQSRDSAYRQLSEVSSLKSVEIEDWLREKTTYLAEPPSGLIATTFERWLQRGGRPDRDLAALQERLRWLKSHAAEYRGVWLFDRDGKLRVSGQDSPRHGALSYRDQIHTATQTRQPVLVDFHMERNGVAGGTVALEVVVPLFAGWGKEFHHVGTLLYEIDPGKFLYPLIQRWPAAAPSAEVLLFRTEGDEIVYLNELRQRPDAPMQLRRRVEQPGEIAAAAVGRVFGPVQGIDYRGAAVLGAVAKVTSRGWYLLTKVDETDVFAETRNAAIGVVATVALLIGALASIGWLGLRHAQQLRQTQSLMAEIARSRSEKQLDYLVRYAKDVVLLMDEDGKVLEANDAAVQAYGRSRDELLSCNIRDLRDPSTLGELSEQLAAARSEHGLFFESRHRRRDGSTFPVEVGSQVIDYEGRRYRQSIIRDISERKQQEQALLENFEALHKLNRKLEEAQGQLLQSEKMASIGQLAAGVAHELNNPIGFVHSNLGTLETYLRDLFSIMDAYERAEGQALAGADLTAIEAIKSEKDFAYLKKDTFQLLEESKDGLARVRKIVQDLKDFSRVGDTDWRWTDLHEGLNSTLNIVWNELKYKCKVNKEYGQMPQVFCLPSQLNQVFMNILVNAGQAIEENGEITLRTGADGDRVWIEISDTGKGIAKENLSRIFEPFYTTKPVGKGTGLGLSLSYSIVKKHQGRIEVDSEVGRGSTFKIVLPVQPDIEESNKRDEEIA